MNFIRIAKELILEYYRQILIESENLKKTRWKFSEIVGNFDNIFSSSLQT